MSYERKHMENGNVLTTDEEIDAVLQQVRNLPDLPRALSAKYNRELDVIVIQIDNGRRLVVPREELQGLDTATPEQIARIEIFGGLDIAWPDLDLDHYLPSLMKGQFGSDRWMQSLENRNVAA